MMKVIVSTVLALFIGGLVFAQANFMSNGTITACTGDFQSSLGFQSAGAQPAYNANENFVMTFCPGVAGNVISMDFASFSLGTGDVLTVYNGNSTAAPILGVYDATNPLLGTIAAIASSNTTGCLTFSFISDAVDSSNGWFAYISCEIPCQPFEIEMVGTFPDTSAGGFIDICDLDSAQIQVQGLYMNNNQNYFQSDSLTLFEWWVDSIPVDSGANISYYPDSIGALLLQVFAVDSHGCEANFNLNYWLRVGTEPDFSPFALSDDTICFDEDVIINIGAESVPWTNADPSSTQPTTYLPDGSGVAPGVYSNTLTFSRFNSGDSIATVADISRFWMVMEHSYLGDLSITMTCPNGSVTTLKQFPGGGARWLGEACDNNNGPTPGIGYLYEWKPTNNTLTDMNAHSGLCTGCPVVNNPCAFGTGTTLQSDSYDPIGTTMNNMIGCPLNGTWTLTITDQWAIDNGFLFTWGVEFDSSMYPSTIVSYDPGIDSTWLDSSLAATSVYSSADSAVVSPIYDDTTYCYTLNLQDNFGCTHDTTLCFYVRDMCDPACYNPISPALGEKPVSCLGGSDGYVWALPGASFIPQPWTYTWKDAAGTVLQTTVFSTTADTLFNMPVGTYTVEVIDGNGCQSTWTKTITQGPIMSVNTNGAIQTLCADSLCTGQGSVVVFSGSAPYSYLWSSGEVSSTATALCPGVNSVTVTDNNGCMDSANITIGMPDSVKITGFGDSLICYGNSTNIGASAIGGTAPYSYSWQNGIGTTATVSVNPKVDESYWVYVTDANNCPADSDEIFIDVRPPLGVTISPIDTVCPGDEIYFYSTASGGDSNYFYAWEQGIGNTANATTIAGNQSQYYSVTITDGCGTIPIEDSVFVQVGGYPQLKVITLNDDTICDGQGFMLKAEASGGDDKYTFTWDNGLGIGQSHVVAPDQTTVYNVTVTDECLTPAGYGQIMLVVGGFPDFELLVDTNVKCNPADFVFALDTADQRYMYELSYGEGWKTVDLLDSLTMQFNKGGCHDIGVRMTTHYDCVSEKFYPCMVQVINQPIAKFDFESHYPNEIENTVHFWDESLGEVMQWNWFMADTLVSEKPRFGLAVAQPGLHNMKLVVANEFGCLDSTNTDFEVAMEPTYFIPEAFTPENGDDLNQQFRMYGTRISNEDFVMEIYDRWGGLVFKSTSMTQGWDGTESIRGEKLEGGKYLYHFRFRLHSGLQLEESGHVLLIR